MTRAGSAWAATLKGFVLVAALIGCATSAYAGETSLYFKSGWYTWDETVNGSSFVKEKGVLHGLGVTRQDDVSLITLSERFELWGGNLDYDGHDVTGSTPINGDTNYFGTREEVALSVKLPAGNHLIVEPFAGVGHKFWLRTRSSEDWNTFYGKGGVAAEMTTSSGTLFARGGAMVPIYTRTHVSLSDSGYEDVVIEPASRISAFAEGGMRVGDFTLSVEYEGMEFGQSPKVPVRGTSSAGKGAVVSDGTASQPASSSNYVSLKLTFTF